MNEEWDGEPEWLEWDCYKPEWLEGFEYEVKWSKTHGVIKITGVKEGWEL